MKLKKGIDLIEFISTVKECKDDVLFHTIEGDCLNLKSALAQFVFASLLSDSQLLEMGHFTCANEVDYIFLISFFENQSF